MKSFGLRARLTLTICASVALVLATLVFLQVRESYAYARQEAFSKATETAMRHADRTSRLIEAAATNARGITQTFEDFKAEWVDDRGLYNSVLKQALSANKSLAGVWTVWEPDALDGSDADHAGRTGYDDTGRFIPLWIRNADGLFDLTTVPGYADDATNVFWKLRYQKLYDSVLATPVKPVDVAVFEITKAHQDGTFTAGNTVYDLSVDGVGYSTSGDFLEQDVIDAMEEAKQQIIDGEIDVPAVP